MIKRCGPAVTAMLLLVWIASRWVYCGVVLVPTVGVQVYAGQVHISWGEPWSLMPWEGHWQGDVSWPDAPPFEWWFGVYGSTVGSSPAWTTVDIPIWFLALLIGALTFWLRRRDHVKGRGLPGPGGCAKCGYSRVGLPPGRACPECGALAETPGNPPVHDEKHTIA